LRTKHFRQEDLRQDDFWREDFFHGDCSVESDRVDGAVTPVLLKAADICHTLAPHTGLFLVSVVVLV